LTQANCLNHQIRCGRKATERKLIVNYLSGTGVGIVAGSASLAATGASSTAHLIIAASLTLVLGGLTTYCAAAHRRRRDAGAAGN
jgi:hypothetical protein